MGNFNSTLIAQQTQSQSRYIIVVISVIIGVILLILIGVGTYALASGRNRRLEDDLPNYSPPPVIDIEIAQAQRRKILEENARLQRELQARYGVPIIVAGDAAQQPIICYTQPAPVLFPQQP